MRINTTDIDSMAGMVTYTPRTSMEEVMHFISSHSTYIILVILAITIYFIYKKYGARVKRYITDMTAKQKRIFIVMQVIAVTLIIVMDYQLGGDFYILDDMFMQDAISRRHFRISNINGEETLIAWAIALFPIISILTYNYIQKGGK